MKKIAFALSIYFLMSFSCSFANEKKIIETGKHKADSWFKILSEPGISLNGDAGSWVVYRSSVVPGSTGYDIKKTDSIISPYLLIISANARWENNSQSRRAEVPTIINKKIMVGFETEESALKNMTEDDFSICSDRETFNIQISYAYQNGKWVLLDFGPDFIRYLDRKSSTSIKQKIPKDLL